MAVIRDGSRRAAAIPTGAEQPLVKQALFQLSCFTAYAVAFQASTGQLLEAHGGNQTGGVDQLAIAVGRERLQPCDRAVRRANRLRGRTKMKDHPACCAGTLTLGQVQQRLQFRNLIGIARFAQHGVIADLEAHVLQFVEFTNHHGVELRLHGARAADNVHFLDILRGQVRK
ncbi:hypothetical protein D9M71_666700 [compost metagenome]